MVQMGILQLRSLKIHVAEIPATHRVASEIDALNVCDRLQLRGGPVCTAQRRAGQVRTREVGACQHRPVEKRPLEVCSGEVDANSGLKYLQNLKIEEAIYDSNYEGRKKVIP